MLPLQHPAEYRESAAETALSQRKEKRGISAAGGNGRTRTYNNTIIIHGLCLLSYVSKCLPWDTSLRGAGSPVMLMHVSVLPAEGLEFDGGQYPPS